MEEMRSKPLDLYRAGISPFQQGSSLFSRGRVRYRRELVQPTGAHPTNPFRTQMRPAPNGLPQRRTILWGQRNAPFTIQYPTRTEAMLLYDPVIQSYIPEPYSTMERDGSIVIPDADVLVKHAFDRTCSHLIHRAGENLIIHNVEGTLKAYLWKAGALAHLLPQGTVQRCVDSLPDLASKIPPETVKTLGENEVLHLAKNHVVGLEDVDSEPHTLVSFHYQSIDL